MSKISIILLSYNEKGYLLNAYQSCKRQTFKNIEIIFADDGSDDGSIDLIEDICADDPSAKSFVMEREDSEVIPSIRVSNLIKRALDLATGEYAVILSGDDWFCDNTKFEKAVSFLDDNKGYMSFASGYKVVYPEREEVKNPYIVSNNVFIGSRYLHISCFIFRKMNSNKLLDRMADDIGLVYILAASGRIKYSEEITFAYNQRKSSIMHNMDIVEHDVLELMLYQDVLNYKERTGVYLRGIIGRMFFPLLRCIKNRQKLADSKYQKYLRSCAAYDNDIVGELANIYSFYPVYKKASFCFRIMQAFVLRVFYYMISSVRRKIT